MTPADRCTRLRQRAQLRQRDIERNLEQLSHNRLQINSMAWADWMDEKLREIAEQENRLEVEHKSLVDTCKLPDAELLSYLDVMEAESWAA